MSTVTVSPKYQVVIPKDVRERAGIAPGQKLDVLYYGGRIVLVPVPELADVQARLAGRVAVVEREADRL